ncbi:AAA family ATPase (plasmid) [Microtetraspora malaysiensis]|uniref:AAA family ATPase n=1 Tax=Microtetraspora malaysiensis TaxID=161358 RepID=UPI003D928D89
MTTPSPVQLDKATVDAQLTELWGYLTDEDRETLEAALTALISSGESVRVTIGNMKGGVNKTTTAVHFALALALSGEPVLLVDGDPTNQSCLMWKLGAGDDWPVNLQVMPWATPDLAKRIKAMEGQFKHLVIDTSPQHKDVLRAGLMVTDTLVIPCQPTPMDTAQLDVTFKLAAEMDALSEVAAVVMFARAKHKTNLLKKSFAEVERQGYPVFSTPLYDSVEYAQNFPRFPDRFLGYAPLFAELVAFAAGLDEVPRPKGDAS